jgi:hypothetical protein
MESNNPSPTSLHKISRIVARSTISTPRASRARDTRGSTDGTLDGDGGEDFARMRIINDVAHIRIWVPESGMSRKY